MDQFARSLFELWDNLVNELNYVAMKFQIIMGLFGCLMHLVHQNMHCYTFGLLASNCFECSCMLSLSNLQ